MKSLLKVVMTFAFVTSAMASSTTCTGNGFKAVVAAKTVVLFSAGKKVANLTYESSEGSNFGDQYKITNYSQGVVNGYALSVKTGGFAGISTAEVFHDGIAGLSSIGKMICK